MKRLEEIERFLLDLANKRKAPETYPLHSRVGKDVRKAASFMLGLLRSVREEYSGGQFVRGIEGAKVVGVVCPLDSGPPQATVTAVGDNCPFDVRSALAAAKDGEAVPFGKLTREELKDLAATEPLSDQPDVPAEEAA